MGQFKLVLLDYAFKQIDNPAAQKVLNDIIVMKQKNFLRTDPNYVVMDKHDMIGTHYLIYDTSDFVSPKLIFALRCTYEERCKQHAIKTPFQDLVPKLSLEHQKEYELFHAKYPSLVDCNSWCVDVDYSLKKSGLRLSDVGYALQFLHLDRLGQNHFIGCTNEKYRASKWLENVGEFKKGLDFIHPMVPDTHRIILMEDFKREFFQKVILENIDLFKNIFELLPTEGSFESLNEMVMNKIVSKKENQPNNSIDLSTKKSA